MKRVFGTVEAVFDALYLAAALMIGGWLLVTGAGSSARTLAGAMALILACGDAFHLIPRILVIKTGDEERLRPALGLGKLITSITMTAFYIILWHLGLLLFTPQGAGVWTGLVYLLAAVRVILCLLPQNKWRDRYPPVNWGIWRNVPFFLLGVCVAVLFCLERDQILNLRHMWLAIALSFGFYLPVVLWSNKNPKIGMFMLPKTCAYVWMLVMCLSL
ncbi:conserved membrane hypothetical protein [uncultured Eubacteriales bacterium]|uniref:Uncharacterized protein n=1 Tax=uncultured Eubacteriales bacterium TaxID=172733 RepID=A0A212JPT1_9FIRM|nr:conserved membrane hypothetical protein [uncultured Eubacteriales bacterium]